MDPILTPLLIGLVTSVISGSFSKAGADAQVRETEKANKILHGQWLDEMKYGAKRDGIKDVQSAKSELEGFLSRAPELKNNLINVFSGGRSRI